MVLDYDLTNDNYLDFVAELREEAKDKDKYSHGRPILPSESDADPPYIDVNLLKSGVDNGLVRIRRFDFQLVHYQDPLGYVIDVDQFNLYDDESRLVESGLEGLLLGLPMVIQAVESLANSSKENVDVGTSFLVCDTKKSTSSQFNSDVRTCLAVLCLVLCEAAKLDLLSCWLNTAFKSNSELPLSSWLFQRINDWGFFSKELLDVDIHVEVSDCNLYLLGRRKNDWNDGRRVIGVTCQDVAQCLGILRAVPPPPALFMEEDFLPSKILVEIYSVSVFFNSGRSGFVYGTIKADNGNDTFCIYDRDHTNCESIESHGTLSLQDPYGPIDAESDRLSVHLDLTEAGGNFRVKNRLMWDGDVREDRFDTRLTAFVRGNDGYAIVHYTVFDCAIQGVVEATLISKGGGHSDAVCVYGKLSARYREFYYASDSHFKYFRSVLFDKFVSKESDALPCPSESGKCKCGGEKVKHNESIKLSRSFVPVQVADALIIEADLKSCDGTPLATGLMEWSPGEFGEFVSNMQGDPNDSHILQVKLIWR